MQLPFVSRRHITIVLYFRKSKLHACVTRHPTPWLLSAGPAHRCARHHVVSQLYRTTAACAAGRPPLSEQAGYKSYYTFNERGQIHASARAHTDAVFLVWKYELRVVPRKRTGISLYA
ncbi:hypothetical protein IG631_08327 [Alternaria alternata]|nr:hypothetical protein IG631_08327 [Alternaria alternata]